MKQRFQTVNFEDKSFPFNISWSKNSVPYPNLHSHSHEIEIHYIISGKGTYLVKDRLYNVNEGNLLVIHRNELHRLTSVNKNDSLNKICLTFSSSIFDNYGDFKEYIFKNLFKCNKKFSHLLQFESNISAELDYIFRSINRDYTEKRVLWRESIIAQLIRLSIIIKRCNERANKEVQTRIDESIQKVLSYIDKNITEELSLNSIAEKVGLSPNYLSSKFKKLVGISLKDYIIAKRINEAKRKLEYNLQDKIISVAYDVGFKDLSHFNHTFKRLTGFSPSKYREIIKS
jgi:AraC-like DNA-binding protein/mannose-6-phosphate isomerase-like protein (cupin superfamily)